MHYAEHIIYTQYIYAIFIIWVNQFPCIKLSYYNNVGSIPTSDNDNLYKLHYITQFTSIYIINIENKVIQIGGKSIAISSCLPTILINWICKPWVIIKQVNNDMTLGI